ncbi:MAG: response regulator [Bryobacteraceae bacterium]|jgi:two-component system, cell cycle sensor histidine kinase and response regulator CckA
MQTTTDNRGTILVVDDDPAVLVLIQSILTASNYRVLPAVERVDALRLAAQKHIHLDLALIDVCMPGVGGPEFAAEIQAIRPEIRLLWMSGIVDEQFVRIRVAPGYAGFLPKPLRHAGLLRAIEQAIAGGAPVPSEPCGAPARVMSAGAVAQ